MISEPSRRPAHLKPPANLSPSKPVPAPEPISIDQREGGGPKGLEPTRYGDWESKGIAIDF